MARLIVLTLAIASCASAAFAQVDGIWGSGHTSCKVWKDMRDDNRPVAIALDEWVAGFISASNVPPTGKPQSDNDTDMFIDGWLKAYCAAHPNVLLPDAARAFVQERRKKS